MIEFPDGFVPEQHRHLGCCGVLAVAMLADVPFQTAWDALLSLQPRPKRWRGGTTHTQRLKALALLGVATESAQGLPRRTLATIVRSTLLEPGVTYMVRVRGHVVTVRNGIVVDQAGALPIAQHPSRRKIVTNIARRA